MTEHELFLLAAGASIGSYLTLLSWLIADYVTGRRGRKALRAAEAKLKAAEEKAAV